MNSRVLCPLILLVAPLARSSAQTVYVVGPGQTHTTLVQAEAAAVHGDVLLLLPGTHAGVTTSKGITIGWFGPAANPPVLSGASSAPILTVTGLPAGRRFVACNLVFASGPNLSSIRLDNNQGSVHLEHITANQATTTQMTFAVFATACAHVTLANCTLNGGTAVHADNSTVAISACNLRGSDARIQPPLPLLGPLPAVAGDGSQFEIADSVLLGGYGATNGFLVYPPAPAIVNFSATSTFLCSGNAASSYTAGTPAAAGTGAAAIATAAGIITIDGRIVLAPTPGYPPITSINAPVFRQSPTVVTAGLPPGGIVTVTLEGVPNDGSQLLVGLPAAVTATPVGNLWMDAATLIVVDSVTLGGTGIRTTNLTIPTGPGMLGICLVFQHLSGNGTNWLLSTPCSLATL